MNAPSYPASSVAPPGVLLLTEDEVRRLLTMEMAMEAVEAGLRKMALDEAQNVPRAARADRSLHAAHVMSAADQDLGVMGTKVYATSPQGHRAVSACCSSTARPGRCWP